MDAECHRTTARRSLRQARTVVTRARFSARATGMALRPPAAARTPRGTHRGHTREGFALSTGSFTRPISLLRAHLRQTRSKVNALPAAAPLGPRCGGGGGRGAAASPGRGAGASEAVLSAAAWRPGRLLEAAEAANRSRAPLCAASCGRATSLTAGVSAPGRQQRLPCPIAFQPPTTCRPSPPHTARRHGLS